MKNNSRKYAFPLARAVVATLLALWLFYAIPVHVTIFMISGDKNQFPFGEITKTHPLETCLPSKLDLTGYRDVKAELLLATYNRMNTSHYTFEFYNLNNGRKDLINETGFDGAGVSDNSYKAFDLQQDSTTIANPCFSLISDDAMDENAITVWMNGKSEPIIKISAAANMSGLINRLNNRNIILLGEKTVLGVFFIYLVSLIYLALYLLTNRDGAKEISKPAHHKRTHSRRV
jgi:hypothetical protein